MLRYKKLLPNLYSADLIYGKIDLKPNHGFSCFFIVQHTDDREFIRNQAMQLLLAGCRNYYFFGEKGPAWHIGFDEIVIVLNPNSTFDNIALTSSWSTVEEFSEALLHEISCRPFIPHDYYLLYDDTAIYEKVLRIMNV